jgi:hypothetical protein
MRNSIHRQTPDGDRKGHAFWSSLSIDGRNRVISKRTLNMAFVASCCGSGTGER